MREGSAPAPPMRPSCPLPGTAIPGNAAPAVGEGEGQGKPARAVAVSALITRRMHAVGRPSALNAHVPSRVPAIALGRPTFPPPRWRTRLPRETRPSGWTATSPRTRWRKLPSPPHRLYPRGSLPRRPPPVQSRLRTAFA